MGIANPVTKETSGSVYMQELSRQLADFVIRLLTATSSGGMMQLVEVYCAFNRFNFGTNSSISHHSAPIVYLLYNQPTCDFTLVVYRCSR